ncbi:MAG: Sua5/YciO/YrdC/YwlC family protein [Candidatus Gracilibacteria bacterium]|nr:Sua5/YciO/YrdC/YwlC family protein [Candidatus Gracilibacteria bacterium]
MIFLLPTDTCYGLAGEFTEQDYQEIYRLKGRDFTKPLAWLVKDYEDLQKYIEITDEQIEFLKKYPRPWSILGKKREDFVLPEFLNPITYEKISLRVAEKCIIADIRDNLSYPLFLTSANISGNPESKTLAEAREYFPGLKGVDGGICDEPPSDIFEFGEDGEVKYLRK